MTSTLQLPRRSRRLVPIIVIVLGLLLISAVMIGQVAAQDNGGLRPPFKLIEPANLSEPLSGVPPLPFNAPIVMSQTFDSSFVQNVSYNFNVNISGVPWHLVNASGVVDTSYTWGRVVGAPMTDTLWNAETTPPGGVVLNAGQPYTKNMQAYAIYGPINMRDYTSAFISVTYALDTLDGDPFGVAYSTNGTDFTWIAATSGRDPSLSNRHTDYYPIPASAVHQSQIWIALVFTSQNRDNIDALGVFVDNVVLRALPAYKIFLPILRFDPTPTPTLTPTPTATPQNIRYAFTFADQTSTNNPDFNYWGGNQLNSCATGTCTYYQDLARNLGHPDNAFKMWMQGYNGSGGAGPRVNGTSLSTAINFEYSADMLVYNGELNARLGLAFDASTSTFPDSGSPPMDTGVNYYLLELRMDSTTRTKVATWQFLQVANGGRNPVTTAANLPVSFNQGEWHNVKVVQQDATIYFYLDGAYVGQGTFDSANWNSNRRRFGLYIDVRNDNGDGGPFEFFSDNILVRDR